MTERPVTLSPNEIRRVLDLGPGDTMTLTRAFDPQPPAGYFHWPPDLQGFVAFTTNTQQGDKGEPVELPSPLGQPGDVLMAEAIFGVASFVLDRRVYALAVVSVTPRFDGETWVIDAEVQTALEGNA